MELPLSVIIPSYNRRESLLRLLRSIASQDLPADSYEVIVVLDGSTDGSRGAVEQVEWPFSLTVLEQANAGQAAARNAGIAIARGKICVFADDDLEFLAGALEGHRAAHEGMVPRAVLGTLEAPQSSSASYRRRQVGRLKRLDPGVARHGGRVKPAWFYSGHFSMGTAEIAGFGFRPDLRRLDDAELAARLDTAGVPLVFQPELRALLHNEKSRKAVFADAFREGEVVARLWREDRETSMRMTSSGRTHKPAWQVCAVALGAAIPISTSLTSRVGVWPSHYPGRGRLLRALWLHAYFRGARRQLRGLAEWDGFLNRPGTLG